MGGYYTDCDINKFFDSMTTLISSEGLSSMGARAGGSYLFEYKTFQDAWAGEAVSTFARGEATGDLFGAITNYRIWWMWKISDLLKTFKCF